MNSIAYGPQMYEVAKDRQRELLRVAEQARQGKLAARKEQNMQRRHLLVAVSALFMAGLRGRQRK